MAAPQCKIQLGQYTVNILHVVRTKAKECRLEDLLIRLKPNLYLRCYFVHPETSLVSSVLLNSPWEAPLQVPSYFHAAVLAKYMLLETQLTRSVHSLYANPSIPRPRILVIQAVIVASVTKPVAVSGSVSLLFGGEAEESTATRLLHGLGKCLIPSDLNVAD